MATNLIQPVMEFSNFLNSQGCKVTVDDKGNLIAIRNGIQFHCEYHAAGRFEREDPENIEVEVRTGPKPKSRNFFDIFKEENIGGVFYFDQIEDWAPTLREIQEEINQQQYNNENHSFAPALQLAPVAA